jgi:beta-phosphoglucomutase-like phosphatase (HAD superfamily)
MKPKTKIRAVIWDMDGVLVRENLSAQPKTGRKSPASPSSSSGEQLDRPLVEFIRAMRSTIQTALLVNNWTEVWQTVAHKTEIDEAFDRVILPPERELRRAHERLYTLAAGELGIHPAEAVLVDDSPQNISAARTAGLRAIHFEDPAQVGSELLELLMEPM